MFPYRLAAVDLDDTLLGPDKRISVANVNAVNALREQGVQIVLASGRRHENMLRFHQQLGLSGPIVSCNGAQVREAETGEVLHQRLVPADLAGEIIAEGKNLGATQNYYHTDGNLYVHDKNHWTDVYESRTLSNLTRCEDLSALLDHPPLKIIWVADPAQVADLFPRYESRFAGRLYVTVTDPEYLEFMAPGVSKAAGIAVIAARMGFDQSEVLAFGDGNNDVPMLEWAGLGIAMADGRIAAKKAADRVAPPGDPETGFARAVAEVLTEYEQRPS